MLDFPGGSRKEIREGTECDDGNRMRFAGMPLALKTEEGATHQDM